MKLSKQIQDRMNLTRARLWADTYRIASESKIPTNPDITADNALRSFDSRFPIEESKPAVVKAKA